MYSTVQCSIVSVLESTLREPGEHEREVKEKRVWIRTLGPSGALVGRPKWISPGIIAWTSTSLTN